NRDTALGLRPIVRVDWSFPDTWAVLRPKTSRRVAHITIGAQSRLPCPSFGRTMDSTSCHSRGETSKMPAALTSYANGSVFTVQLRMDQNRKKFFDTDHVSTTFSANEQSFDLAVVQFDDDGRPGHGQV